MRQISITGRVTPAHRSAEPGTRERGGAVLGRTRQVVAELFGKTEERGFAVRYWTGLEERSGDVDGQAFTLILRHPGALRRMLFPPSELALGEAFVLGDVDVDGDLERAAALAPRMFERLRSPRRLARIVAGLLRLPSGRPRGSKNERVSVRPGLPAPWQRRRRAAQLIRYHYDVGNSFYGLWLDANRVYSCAYFPTGVEDLNAAQAAKLEYICRKLRLHPGERMLDIGCGWGGLIRYACRHHGVEAVGITLSPAQAAYAREQIARDGLTDRCSVDVRDYRDLPAEPAFDKVASVGMFEHVGPRRLRTYFEAVFRLTRPGGLFLNHGIVSLEDARPRDIAARLARRLWRQGEFMSRYVFPEGELATLGEAIRHGEASGFELRDVESLREHYARTLRHWVQRLEGRRADAVAAVGEFLYRVWRLYMSVSAHAFATGRVGVAQMLLAKPDADGRCVLPPTRGDLYA